MYMYIHLYVIQSLTLESTARAWAPGWAEGSVTLFCVCTCGLVVTMATGGWCPEATIADLTYLATTSLSLETVAWWAGLEGGPAPSTVFLSLLN